MLETIKFAKLYPRQTFLLYGILHGRIKGTNNAFTFKLQVCYIEIRMKALRKVKHCYTENYLKIGSCLFKI